MVLLVKTFDHYHHKFQFFYLSWNLDQTLIMVICTALFGKLYTTLKQKEPRRQNITKFSLKYSKKMRSLRSWKCLKTSVELTFTTQKAKACSTWTSCSFFDWKYLFRVNLVQKFKIISLSWNFLPRLIQICRIPWWCSLFLFSNGNTFLGKSGPENPNCQFELKSRTRLIGICRIM